MNDYVSGVIAGWKREQPDLDTSAMEVVNRVLRAGQMVQGRLDAVATGHGLSHKGDLDVLTALRRSGPPYELSPSRLARDVQLTTGGMTIRLDRLEARGLVARRPDPSDRRGILVRLTDVGTGIVDAALQDILTEDGRILLSLSAEQRDQLARLLEHLLIGMGDQRTEHVDAAS